MSTRTFHADLGSPLDANWIASRRIVNAFAPHESAVPDMSVSVDPGHLVINGNLIEVGAQAVAIEMLDRPPGEFRIDRICIDRTTGAALRVVGALNQFAPPSLPAGSWPVARVHVTGGVPSITNGVVIDERSMSCSTTQEITCRLELADEQTISRLANTASKVRFTSASIDVGTSFVDGGFKPPIAGRYSISARTAMKVPKHPAKQWCLLRAFLYVDGERRAVLNTYLKNDLSSDEVYATVQITDILELDGTQTVELYVSHAQEYADDPSVHGATVMMAHRLG